MYRLVLRRSLRLPVAAVRRSSAAVTALEKSSFSDSSTPSTSLWVAGLMATTTAAAALLHTDPVNCEAAAESAVEAPIENNEVLEEEDPYENLPEEDEETDCSMCNTFRKGPCRPQWRKLERCFKNHEGEENGAVKCMRYFKPHQMCLMDYTNLYQLVSLDVKQELVRDAELSVSEHERRQWDPVVDWSTWIRFVGDAGLSFCETIRSKDEDGKPLALWKRLPENKEPVLLTLPVPLPKVDEESGMILKIAYALDQDGMVLSLTYNKEYGELIEQSQKKNEEGSKEEETSEKPSDEAEEKGEVSDTFEFDFFVLPGDTKEVRICALYAENPVTASPDKDILDALLFKSKAHVLKDIVDTP